MRKVNFMPAKIPFTKIDWNEISRTGHPGEAGTSFWQTVEFSGLRIRIVEYSAGYLADHWCQKGHIVHCLEGSFTTEQEGQENGAAIVLEKGMTYLVSDEMSSHRSVSENGVKLLIIDGSFLAGE